MGRYRKGHDRENISIEEKRIQSHLLGTRNVRKTARALKLHEATVRKHATRLKNKGHKIKDPGIEEAAVSHMPSREDIGLWFDYRRKV